MSAPIIYEEYLGTCLLYPMEAGVQYMLQMYIAGSSVSSVGDVTQTGAYYGPVDITIFGSSQCPEWAIIYNFDQKK